MASKRHAWLNICALTLCVALGGCRTGRSAAAEVSHVDAPAEAGEDAPAQPQQIRRAYAIEPSAPAPVEIEETETSVLARTLAGLPCERGLADADLLERHATRTAADYAEYERSVGEPMSAWADAHLQRGVQTVFYPFAGADFPTAHRLYPQARRYILVAMQPGGKPPALTGADDPALVLRAYAKVLDDFARRGFFVTQEMNDEMGRKLPVPGLTGVLAMLAEREGLQVKSIEPIRVDEDGRVVPHEGERSRDATWRSVRLNLRRRSDGQDVTLDYLRLNLGDGSLSKHEGDRLFVEQAAAHPVVVKAASHLMQMRYGFSTIRTTLLQHAPSIVQEETGIPYGKLVDHFDVELFGRYGRNNVLFRDRPQEDLAAAYEAMSEPRELPFDFGYRKAAGSCLQYAVRVGA